MNGMRLNLAPTSPTRRPFAKVTPEPPAAANAGISSRKPQGIAVFTDVTSACDPNNPLRAVDSQNVAIVAMASAPAMG